MELYIDEEITWDEVESEYGIDVKNAPVGFELVESHIGIGKLTGKIQIEIRSYGIRVARCYLYGGSMDIDGELEWYKTSEEMKKYQEKLEYNIDEDGTRSFRSSAGQREYKKQNPPPQGYSNYYTEYGDYAITEKTLIDLENIELGWDFDNEEGWPNPLKVSLYADLQNTYNSDNWKWGISGVEWETTRDDGTVNH